MMKNWVQILISLILEHLEMGATTESIMTIILQNMVKFGGLIEKQLIFQWVCLGFQCDNNYFIYGHHKSIITQVKDNIVPYLIIVHYVVHQINLFIIVLTKLSLVSHIETLLQALCALFVHNPKNNLDLSKLAKTFDTKGQKLFKNVKKHWINMLNPLKQIFG